MDASPLRSDETVLIGRWLSTSAGMVEDEVTKRIRSLVADSLIQIAGGGWETLYRDPRDHRLWELTYPQGEMHGGGPPMLVQISAEDASRKYSSSASNNRWREP